MTIRFIGAAAGVAVITLILVSTGCSTPRGSDRQPELAQRDGYFVDRDRAVERGGVGNYVSPLAFRDQSEIKPADEDTASVDVQTIPSLSRNAEFVYFDRGDATIGFRDLPELSTIARQLKNHPDVNVRIDGYADSTGIQGENMTLSKLRAENVKEYLCDHGASEDQIQVYGHGSRLAAPATSVDGSREDRKVMISLWG